MSLHTLANHLQSAGRGEDKVLVHMTPGEVNGLQSLAMANGGSLTVNPETGLPEAGFLSSILPMIAGFALGPAGFAMTAPMAALTVGAATGLATGSLKKGIMAGMGAYGGAGLGEGLMAQGAAAGSPSVLTPAIPNAGVVSANTATPSIFTAAPDYSTGIANSLGDSMSGFRTGLPSVTPPTSVTPGVQFNPIQAAATSPTPSVLTPMERMSQVGTGLQKSGSGMEGLKGLYGAMPMGSVAASGLSLSSAMQPEPVDAKKDSSMIRPYEFNYGATNVGATPYTGSAERTHFQPQYTALAPYAAPGPEYSGFAAGGPIEDMSAMNAIGANTGYPMARLQSPAYSNPSMQQPEATNVVAPSADVGVGAYSGEARFAAGGISDLGGYSDGGRLLRGPGDGVSDSIPASIGDKQPARLADGEFVIPARVVSELGNGSTEAGARKLYAMMDRVQKARRKTVGNDQVARNTKAEKLLPA